MTNDKINDKKNDKISDKINNTDNGIVFEMQKNKYITIPELSFILMKSTPTIYRHIDAMVSKGKLKRVGSRKTGYWDVIDKKND